MADDGYWTAERIQQLRDLWTQEDLSASAIATRMRITKNAVVGKAHRLCLPARPSPIRRRPDGASPTTKPRKAPVLAGDKPTLAALGAAPVPAAAPTPPPPARIGPVRPCAWPIGEPGKPGFRFCGEPKAPGARLPYCAEHMAVAVVRKAAAE